MAAQDITVLGAGVAGLTIATALARVGATVTVLERAEEIREVGAGLQISPNGLCVLDALGLGPAVRDLGTRSLAVDLRNYLEGRPVARLNLPQTPETLLLHRADLIGLLAEAARDAGARIRLLQSVDTVEIEEGSGRPAVRMVTGGMLHPDVLIGADGLHSPTRRAVLAGSGAERPFFTGQVAWRALVPGQHDDPPQATVYLAPGRHLVSYPLRGGTLRNIVAVEERDSWTEEGWHHVEDPTRLQRAFSSFAPEVRGWLSDAREVYLWGLFRHHLPRTWHRGGAVLIGDALHPTLPFLAQGANMALEDAWVLATALARSAPRDAFVSYQAQREARVGRILRAANSNARAFHLPHGPVRSIAHAGLRTVSRLAPDLLLRRYDWLYGHDVTAAGALESQPPGASEPAVANPDTA